MLVQTYSSLTKLPIQFEQSGLHQVINSLTFSRLSHKTAADQLLTIYLWLLMQWTWCIVSTLFTQRDQRRDTTDTIPEPIGGCVLKVRKKSFLYPESLLK